MRTPGPLARGFTEMATSCNTKNPKIVIIGAGAAGIAAATKLLENGFDGVTILEAENRIGGRINSVKFQGRIVDLGAQWCHGEKNNVVFESVKGLNLLGSSFNQYDDHVFYESTGKIVDKSVTDRLCQIAEDVAGDYEEMSNFEGSFGDYFIKCYQERAGCELENDNANTIISGQLLDWFHKFNLCLNASPTWFDVSAKYNTHYAVCEGDQLLHWKDKGYRIFLDVLMKKYPDLTQQLHLDDRILLNKEVSTISWNNTNDLVTVRCSDNSSYNAEHVVFTGSLGVLKENHKNLFVPQLPVVKQNAIKNLGFGNVNKILLKFPHKWWPNDCRGFSFVWTQEDLEKLPQEFPHGPSKDGRSWLADVFGFYVIDSHPEVLLGWGVGECSREIELLPDEVLISGCVYLLGKFLGQNIQKPDSVLCSQWSLNPHFRGSYSYRSVDTEKARVTPESLAEPLRNLNEKQVVFFAGEASHERYYSTVHGAVETGWREADRILNMYRNRECKVAIVGAGLAGLGAAQKLLKGGCSDIVILEAQNRPGGRIHTYQLENGFVELGAQWLHGDKNDLYKLAKDHDLITDEISYEGLGTYIRDDGTIIDEELVETVDFEIGRIYEACERFVNADVYPNSFGEYFEERFNSYISKCDDIEDIRMMKLELYDWHVKFQMIDNGCADLKTISAKQFGNYMCGTTNGQSHINLKNGYKSIIDLLTQSLPEDALQLNKAVTRIQWKNSEKVEITCEDGSNIRANHVIVTASLGTLKNTFRRLFEPPLPEPLPTAIRNLGFYNIGKIFLFFDEKWWTTEGFQLIWRRSTVLSHEDNWLRFITGFDEIVNQPNVLLGWIGGEGSSYMEGLSEEMIGNQCVDLLRRFLGDDTIPYPSKIIRSTWASCPFVNGGYSYTTNACDGNGVSAATLCEPVYANGIPRVLLAGEATHLSHFSTTHGAFESGQQQAKVVLRHCMPWKLGPMK